MTTEEKKVLLSEVSNALRALGRIVDGPHTHNLTQVPRFSHNDLELLAGDCIAAMAGLSFVESRLEADLEDGESK